jgi:hypothetical protein
MAAIRNGRILSRAQRLGLIGAIAVIVALLGAGTGTRTVQAGGDPDPGVGYPVCSYRNQYPWCADLE